MAIKYLAGNRLWGTDAERLAMTVLKEFVDNPISDVWTVVNPIWTIGSGRATVDGTANSEPNICRYDLQDTFGSGVNLSDTTWTIRWSSYLDIVTGSSGFHSMPIGIYSGTGATEDAGTENGIEAMVLDAYGSSSANVYDTYCSWVENGTLHSTYGPYSGHDCDQARDTQYWYELPRISADDFTLKTYDADTYDVADQVGDTWTASSDSAYSASDVEAITDLRYVELGYRNGNAGFTGIGWNTLMEVYNETLTPPATNTLPNLPNGATFLTSDTNKLYMFDGTDTWNEVA